jgi:DDE_Tnp_1-associated
LKIKKHLNFTSLRKKLSEVFRLIPDWRQSAKTNHSLHDALMSGYAAMYFQDPSLLQFQMRMQEDQHRNNLNTLFDVKSIPKETQMREIIDGVDSEYFRVIFKDFYSRLQRGKHLEQYQIFPNQYYFPIDGSQFFSSEDIHCEQCLVKEHGGKHKSDSHQVLQGGIMHPDCKEVIPFMPEQICNADGTDKQDCEMNAAKRLLKKVRCDFPQLRLIMGGDGLFSKQPMIEEVLQNKMSYIFSAKPSDHKYLREWIDTYDHLPMIQLQDDKGRIHIYEWMNDVPLNGREDTVKTNFFRCKIISHDKGGEEKISYRNDWVTDQLITAENISTLVRAGRCRWKNENECFNVMKNHGYCMERNYGHGKKNLAFNFYLLTLLAFFFHQIFELTDRQYQSCRKKFGSKRHLWEKLRAYIDIIIFETWEHLLDFALQPKKGLLTWAHAP